MMFTETGCSIVFMLTQKKIAQTLGLSCATVTNILNQKPGLRYSKETRERVLSAAAAMGYQPNRSWQTVRRGRSNLIGVITLGIEQEIARKAASILPLEINAIGYDYMVIDFHWHGGRMERLIEELIRARVEGVVICFMTESFGPQYVDLLKRAGIPMVAIDGDASLGIPVVWNDVRTAFEKLTRHLLDQGHRRLLMVTGSAVKSRPVQDRMAGFEQAMKNYGPIKILREPESTQDWNLLSKMDFSLPHGTIVQLDYKNFGHNPTKVLYSFSKQLFKSGDIPDALLCSNDSAAFGVFSAALECGISVPGQMALTGADNDEFGAMPAFGLTTVDIDVAAACQSALKILNQNIANKESSQNSVRLNAKPILRTSSLKKSNANVEI